MAKISIISLGCPRNLVDSEVMIGALKDKGHSLAEKIDKADVVIINTCAFIKDAIDESIETILQLIDLKKKGLIRSIIIAGCLAQRYKKELKNELGEIDGFIGTGDINRIDRVVKGVLDKGQPFLISAEPRFLYSDRDRRCIITPRHYAYVKIQEGCANRCSYCVIPRLRGGLRSRPLVSIISEVKKLTEKGRLSELNIIGQDTTFYGYDLYGKSRVAELLRALCRLKRVKWIRLLYTHPAHYTDALIDAVRDEPSVCNYFDLPIQHISDNILKRMNRKTTSGSIRSLIERLRRAIPSLAIRTTVLIGFPGETESDFKELLHFLKETRFERLGAFSYSNEEGSVSFTFKDQVPEEVKRARLDEVMKLQQKISLGYNESFLGRTMEVLIEEKDSDRGLYIGRTQFDAPSVDGEVLVKAGNRRMRAGSFARVKIIDTMEYDLVGEISD